MVVVQSQRCQRLFRFIGRWLDHSMHLRQDLCEFGSIDCVTESDPRQFLYADRWTFDPMNWNYEKAFWFAWPALVHRKNRNTLGNIFESLLGTRNFGDRHDWPYDSGKVVIISVCTNLSNYVNAVYQLTRYTDAVYDDVDAWTRYVTWHAYH